MKLKISDHTRIIWSITLKDITDVIKNKNIISIILSSLFIVVVYKYLPGLTVEDGPPRLLVYDPENSILLSRLYDSPAVDLYTYKSEEDMKYYLTNGDQPELGLVIPKNFNTSENLEEPLELNGYVLQLFKDEDIQELTTYMEGEFEYILERPVKLSVEKIPLQPETYGMTVLTSMGFVFVTIMVGMMIIPHMMIEEKQNKTIDVLMVSPAGSGHIVLSKAITGLLYTMMMLVIAVAFNWILIQHQWLFLLGGMLGALFSISIGLLLGILIDTRQQLTLWAWFAFIPLLLPMMLSLMDDLLPENVIQVLKWIPSSALFRIFRTSMADTTPIKYFLPQFTLIAICSVVLLSIDTWLVHRLDQ